MNIAAEFLRKDLLIFLYEMIVMIPYDLSCHIAMRRVLMDRFKLHHQTFLQITRSNSDWIELLNSLKKPFCFDLRIFFSEINTCIADDLIERLAKISILIERADNFFG